MGEKRVEKGVKGGEGEGAGEGGGKEKGTTEMGGAQRDPRIRGDPSHGGAKTSREIDLRKVEGKRGRKEGTGEKRAKRGEGEAMGTPPRRGAGKHPSDLWGTPKPPPPKKGGNWAGK